MRNGCSECENAGGERDGPSEFCTAGGSLKVGGRSSSLHAIGTGVVIFAVTSDAGVGGGVLGLVPGDRGVVALSEHVGEGGGGGGGLPGGGGDLHKVASAEITGAGTCGGADTSGEADGAVGVVLDVFGGIVHNAHTCPTTGGAG